MNGVIFVSFYSADDLENIISTMHPIINGMQRVDRAKMLNYVEKTVQLYDDADFLMHFRLSRQLTYHLISRFAASHCYKNMIQRSKTELITAEKTILTFLWFVGHQSASYRDVADRFGVTLDTLYKIVSRVSNFLIEMSRDVIKLPNAQQKEITRIHFLNTKKFPGVIGAVDGTHIEIDRPNHKDDPDSYYTRKKRFAIHVQGVVDHTKKFIHIFLGYPGSVHDARVFRESDLFPVLPNLCSDHEYILADSAYPLLKHVIVPYRDNGHLTARQKNFNKTLSSCRVVVEHAFGALKQRFRQLYHCKLRKLSRIIKLIYACCILHNLADANDLAYFEDAAPPMDMIENDDNVEVVYIDAAIRAYRDDICDTVWGLTH